MNNPDLRRVSAVAFVLMLAVFVHMPMFPTGSWSRTVVRAGSADAALERARTRAAAPFGFLSDTKVTSRLEQLLAAHDTALESAWEWLEDREVYPIPAKAYTGWRPGSDIQPGHDEMEVRVSRAVATNNEIVSLIAKRMKMRPDSVGARLTRKPLSPPVSKVHEYGMVTFESALPRMLAKFEEQWVEYRERLGDAEVPKSEGAPSEDFLAGVAAISRLDIEALDDALFDLEGVERRVLWYLAANRILSWNAEHPCGHQKAEAEAVQVLNGYRIALGLRPLAHHPKVYEMAADYADQMSTLGFMGHEHPSDETRRTLSDRADRVGYWNQLGENCSGVSSGQSNIWRWRSDAGHHLVMIQDQATEIGVGLSTRGVLNTGNGTDRPVTQLMKDLRLR